MHGHCPIIPLGLCYLLAHAMPKVDPGGINVSYEVLNAPSDGHVHWWWLSGCIMDRR
jgi:hypothetical protein